MVDLATTYMGLELAHPIVASASPLSQSLDGVRRLEDGGAAAIVMFSLFEEQIRQENAAFDYLVSVGTESFAESLSYFPEVEDYQVGPESYLELVRRAAEACQVPVIGSLNGVTSEGWIDYARMIEQAGAAGLELNVYYIPAGIDIAARDVEARYLDVIRAVRASVGIPIAMKLSPFFSSFGEMAHQLVEAGADALVVFNRFYQPDFDLDKLEVVPNLKLSEPVEMRLPLLWLAILYGRLDVSLAATTGVHGEEQAVKYLMAGADAVMTTSAVLRHGPDHLGVLRDGLRHWLERRQYRSVAEMKGSMSQRHVADPTAFERANYIRELKTFRNPYVL
jgi:dihydroorotate dehydrogenase (fumarate)